MPHCGNWSGACLEGQQRRSPDQPDASRLRLPRRPAGRGQGHAKGRPVGQQDLRRGRPLAPTLHDALLVRRANRRQPVLPLAGAQRIRSLGPSELLDDPRGRAELRLGRATAVPGFQQCADIGVPIPGSVGEGAVSAPLAEGSSARSWGITACPMPSPPCGPTTHAVRCAGRIARASVRRPLSVTLAPPLPAWTRRGHGVRSARQPA